MTGPADFQGALVRLSDELEPDVGRLTGALSRFDRGEAMRYVSDAYPELVTPYISAAGDLSATWYEDQPARRGAKAFFARPAELPSTEQLAANGRWALTQQDPRTALEGSSRRGIFNQSRETIVNNAHEEGVRWVRHARGGACGFCRMLATRVLTEGHGGAPGLYRSEASASRNTHTPNARGHDHCRCIVVPLRGGADYVIPDYLPQWLDDYERVSRDADGRLLPPHKIADRMEAAGRERGEVFGDVKPKGPTVVDLDAAETPPSAASGAGNVPPEPPRPPGTASAGGDWDDTERARRQDALGIETHGERLERHEIEFVERFQAAGEQLEWIPRDRQQFTPTHDFVWLSNESREVELKSTRARYETIHGRIVDAASRAAKQGVAKTDFMVDIGDQPLTDELREQLAGFNVGRRKYRLTGLWVMSEGRITRIGLSE